MPGNPPICTGLPNQKITVSPGKALIRYATACGFSPVRRTRSPAFR